MLVDIVICTIYVIIDFFLGLWSFKEARRLSQLGQKWKSHLHKLFSGLMLLIVVEVLHDIVLMSFGYDINKNNYYDNVMTMVDTLPVNYIGMMLLCISGHSFAYGKRIAQHFLAFVILLLGYIILPDPGWPWIFSIMYVYYTITVSYRFIKGMRYFANAADEMYANGLERRPHLEKLLLASMLIALVIWVTPIFYPQVPESIAEICLVPIWAFLLRCIHTTRESSLIEPMEMPSFRLTAQEKQEKKPVIEMTEAYANIDSNIEHALREDDFYLSPELNAQLLAEKMHTNRTYISRYFASKDTNFSSYVNAMRMEHARLLIITTDDDITTIARKCGYLTNSTFYKFFRLTYGCEPEELTKKK